MLPQHLLTESTERRATCLESGQTGTLRLYVVYQARGRERYRSAMYRALFTPDDEYQSWDEEDQDYSRTSIGAEFKTRDELDAYVSGGYGSA
jgi:hypothetical protein